MTTHNNFMGDSGNWQSMAFGRDPDTTKLHVFYSNENSRMTVAMINSASFENPKGMHHVYDTANNYVILGYSGGTDDNAQIHPVYYNSSTDAYTGGARTQLHTGDMVSKESDMIFDPDTSRTIIAYKDGSNSNIGTANVIQSTGTSGSPTVSVGADSTFDGTDAISDVAMCYDTNLNKVFIAYENVTDGNMKGTIGTVTGGTTNTIAFAGTAEIFDYGDTAPDGHDVEYDSDQDKLYFIYDESANLRYYRMTPGSTSFTSGTQQTVYSQNMLVSSGTISYGPNYGTFVGAGNASESNKLYYNMIKHVETVTTNLDGDFLGVAAANISDGATGKITVQGGVNENQSGLSIGSYYFADGAGNVALKGDGRAAEFIGKAISATSIQLMDHPGHLFGIADGAITRDKPVIVTAKGKFKQATTGGTTNVDDSNFIGIARKTVADGEQAELTTFGHSHTFKTGFANTSDRDITPSERYYLYQGAINTSTGNGLQVGKAIGENRMLVTDGPKSGS
jgi:hypothetical protein